MPHTTVEQLCATSPVTQAVKTAKLLLWIGGNVPGYCNLAEETAADISTDGSGILLSKFNMCMLMEFSHCRLCLMLGDGVAGKRPRAV